MQLRYASIILTAALTHAAFAQTTSLSVAGNMPHSGQDLDVLRFNTATPTPPGGMGTSFDFSALTGGTAATYQWLNPATLPLPHPPATLALTDGGTDTTYYRDNGGLERVGEKQSLLGLYTVDATYSDGPLELKMPLAYGDTWTDALNATFNVDADPAVRSGSITGTADASGWVTLPGASSPIEVLRVRTHVNETIIINTFITITITHKRHVDAYYASWSKYPVFRTWTDSLASSVGVNQFTGGTEWLQQVSLGVADAAAPVGLGMGLVPNPANGPVDLIWTADGSATTLDVFSATGAAVLKRELGVRMSGEQRTRIETDDWTPGLYLVRLRNAGSAQVLRLTVR